MFVELVVQAVPTGLALYDSLLSLVGTVPTAAAGCQLPYVTDRSQTVDSPLTQHHPLTWL